MPHTVFVSENKFHDVNLGVTGWFSAGSAFKHECISDIHLKVSDVTFTADPNRCDQVGVSAGAFYSSSEPRRPNQIGNSPSLCGGTVIHNTEFANFSTCNFAIENS